MANKYKGTKGPQPQAGLGRLRRAAAKSRSRIGGWERLEDEGEIERADAPTRRTHTGERLLMKFNRLARSTDTGAGATGEICGFSGAAILVRDASGVEHLCQVRQALYKQFAGVRNPLAVGDRVRWQGDGADTVITAIEPRANQLARVDSHNKSLMHVLAANVDSLVVGTSVSEPVLKPNFIDRYLVIAAANGI
jgi:ribosome biogenesis GTPase / thiamine phosphate phosphatase